MEKRVYNFSAGPSMLPLEVLEQAQRELVCYPSAGMSVMEMSHRSKTFENILEKAKADLKELMHIPDNYKILFLQGGGSTQFAMIPMNLIFTVHAFGVPHDVVMALMLPGIIPMNLIKSVVNCVLAGVLFKTLNPFLQKNRYLTQG